MDCADDCICGDGDTDGAGSDLLYVGVLDKKSVLEFDFQNASYRYRCSKLTFPWVDIAVSFYHPLHSLTLPES